MRSLLSSCDSYVFCVFFFFFQAEDGIRDLTVTGVQTCALPICRGWFRCLHRRPAPSTTAPTWWEGTCWGGGTAHSRTGLTQPCRCTMTGPTAETYYSAKSAIRSTSTSNITSPAATGTISCGESVTAL